MDKGPKLKACPFCGSKKTGRSVERRHRSLGIWDEYWVECEDCWATGPTESTTLAATVVWNKRAEPRGA